MYQIRFRLELPQTPQLDFRGPTSKGGEGKGRKGGGKGKREGKGGEGRGREEGEEWKERGGEDPLDLLPPPEKFPSYATET